MTDILSQIKQWAAKEYPGDYSMQAYEIKQQTEAFNKIVEYRKQIGTDNEVANTCLSKALKDWPESYSMQLYEFENQLNAAHEFFPYTHPSIPSDIIDEMKARAFGEWTGDYSMMLYELNNQVEAWLEINR